MTNVEALKELYVSMGGAEEDVANVTTIADMIVALQDVASGGGGGGGGTSVEPVAITSSGTDTYTASISYAEARERVLAGEDMRLAETSASGGVTIYRLDGFSDGGMYFAKYTTTNSSLLIYRITWGATLIKVKTTSIPLNGSSAQ